MGPNHVGGASEGSADKRADGHRDRRSRRDGDSPAGTFKTFKIVCRNKKTGSIRYEQWYSPELKQWVKIRENLDSGLRVRELIAFKLR
jgi:hypothetical protein